MLPLRATTIAALVGDKLGLGTRPSSHSSSVRSAPRRPTATKKKAPKSGAWVRRAGPIHSRAHLHDARDSRELLGGEWQRHLIETAQTSTGSFRFRCIRYLATISAVARANMQSPEAPTASSKIHSSTACMPGRKSELSMYGDLLQNAWEIGYGASSTADHFRAFSPRKSYSQGGSGQCSTGKGHSGPPGCPTPQKERP